MVVKTDWESLHVVDLWRWSDILVLSETCLVGVERLVTRGRMMSARARLDMNNNESLLLEFWKKNSIEVLIVLLTLIYSVIERMKIIKLKTAIINPE